MNTIKKGNVRIVAATRTKCQVIPLAAEIRVGFYIVTDKAAPFKRGGYDRYSHKNP